MSDFANLPVDLPNNPTILDLLKQELGIDPSDFTRDTELTIYIETAGLAVERYIDNIVEQRQVTERHSKSNHPTALRYYPVDTLDNVVVDGVDKTTDYDLYHDEGLAWSVKDSCGRDRNCCFDQMNITYVAGYNPVPPDLGFAIVVAAKTYDTGVQAGNVKKEVINGVGSIEYTTGGDDADYTKVSHLPDSAVGVLDSYRRHWA